MPDTLHTPPSGEFIGRDERQIEADFAKFGAQKAWDEILSMPDAERNSIVSHMRSNDRLQKILNTEVEVSKNFRAVNFDGYQAEHFLNAPRERHDYRQEVDVNRERESIFKRLDALRMQYPFKLMFSQKHLDDFIKGARDNHVSDREIGNTLLQLNRLIEDKPDAPLPLSTRISLLAESIKDLTPPYKIEQGHHNTCLLDAVEVVSIAKQPSSLAHLIAEVSLTGAFTTASGRRIQLSSSQLEPDIDAGAFLNSNTRHYVDQLFQNLEADIFLGSTAARQLLWPQATGLNAIDCKFQPDPTSWFNHADEVFCNIEGESFALKDTNDKKVNEPLIPEYATAYISNEITGASAPLSDIFMPERFANAGSFEEALAKRARQADGKGFPIALGIDGNKGPFKPWWMPTGLADQLPLLHAVTILSYDPSSKTVYYWGSSNSVGLNSLPAAKLYRAAL